MHSFQFRFYAAIALALSPVVAGSCYANTTHIYVANADGTVSVIDAHTQQVVTTVAGLTGPVAIAWDGRTGMYVGDIAPSPGGVFVIDTMNQQISQISGNFNEPSAMALNGGTGMYVTNDLGGTVSIIDTQTGIVSGEVSLPTTQLSSLAFDGSAFMYLIALNDNNVYLINVNSLAVNSMSLPFPPNDVAWDGSTGMYVCDNSFNANIAVINTQTQLLSNLLTLPIGSFNLAWDGGTGMYVTDGTTGVNIINTQTLQPAWTPIIVGNQPEAIAWDGATGMYVVNSFDGSVSVIDTRTFNVVNTIGVGDFPSGIARAVIASSDAKPLLLVVELKNIAEAALELPGGEAVSLVGKPIPDISGSETLKILVSSEGSVIATVTVNLLATTAFSDNPAVLASLVQNNNASVASLKIEMIHSQ